MPCNAFYGRFAGSLAERKGYQFRAIEKIHNERSFFESCCIGLNWIGAVFIECFKQRQ